MEYSEEGVEKKEQSKEKSSVDGRLVSDEEKSFVELAYDDLLTVWMSDELGKKLENTKKITEQCTELVLANKTVTGSVSWQCTCKHFMWSIHKLTKLHMSTRIKLIGHMGHEKTVKKRLPFCC